MIQTQLTIYRRFLSSSGVERPTVNRFVVGSNPTWGETIKVDWTKIFGGRVTVISTVINNTLIF